MEIQRDYLPMIRLAQELQFCNGYLGTDELKRKGRLTSLFNDELTTFVDKLLSQSEAWWSLRELTNVDWDGEKRVGKLDALCALIITDLDRLAAENDGYFIAIAELRDVLIRSIRRSAGKSVIRRKLERYVPTVTSVLCLIGFIAYLGFQVSSCFR